ncbi:hypothetical protein QBC46DRAFT_288199 [Diplogelasinospora grovesii]|uniref:MaoC-like domain-containing protein n=1 Tax=Diplogelasinospora grovesii TaxID=303347 RepID=A0AAN6N7Y8_9PEZI|nr:hypothetical protein QBC46DRAFT_288199 [Diplogelasinospora grovesii]
MRPPSSSSFRAATRARLLLTRLTGAPLRRHVCVSASRLLLSDGGGGGTSQDLDLDLDEYMRSARAALADPSRAKVVPDCLSPTPSHLLRLSLAGHTPDSLPPDDEGRMPLGHHMVYFPPQIPQALLMPDGTDADHCPGYPFVRRMWAGGSIAFSPDWEEDFRLDGRKAVCVETVGEPVLKPGTGSGEDKVFVDVRRQYGLLSRDGTLPTSSSGGEGGGSGNGVVIDETRRLVFLKERPHTSQTHTQPTPDGTATQNGNTGSVKGLIEKGPSERREADFGFSLKPDAKLLFHFSALTFNAHAIHLDTNYAKNIEGHKDLLVHGPLTLVLMLTALNQIKQQEGVGVVRSIDYRNLAPLYVGDEIRVCVKKQSNTKGGGGENEKKNRWNVWIEGPGGRLAVKGTAVTVATSRGE